MGKNNNNKVTTLGEAIHEIQLALLDGIKDEDLLFAAGTILSRPDYADVVTERSISDLCGYPLCSNSKPPEPPKKGHYRVSIKDHKVYDLHETHLYCSSRCLINSRAFAGSLPEERIAVLNAAKVSEVLRRFGADGAESEDEETAGEKLVVVEKEGVGRGEVTKEEWMGAANAIEGYVPQRDRRANSSIRGNGESRKNKIADQNEVDFKISAMPDEKSSICSKVQKSGKTSQNNHLETLEPWIGKINFTSTILTNDEYNVSKKSVGSSKLVPSGAKKDLKQKKSGSKKGKDTMFGSMDFLSTIITEDEYSVSKLPASQSVPDTEQVAQEFSKKLNLGDSEMQIDLRGSLGLTKSISQMPVGTEVTGVVASAVNENASTAEFPSHHSQNDASSSSGSLLKESCLEQYVHPGKSTAKSSLRTSGGKKTMRSVSWADEKPNGVAKGNLCEYSDFNNSKEGSSKSKSKELKKNEDSEWFTSAEACAMALSQAADTVVSGLSDAADAVSEAGIIVLSESEATDMKEELVEDEAMEDMDTVKWPQKPSSLNSDVLDSDTSWFDAPPEGFGLTLSPFALMWNAIFSWLTSSSLAYIYGKDDSFHEEYMSINGREYPRKVVLPDGRSSEIKQAVDGCLSRALPGLISDLTLSTPVSTIEQTLACLLDTMSFMDALPPFRMKQWQVIALLFIDALSVCRIPGLTPHLKSTRVLIREVLNAAQISNEEYEIMKDMVIPLGRVLQFDMQKGG